MSKLKCAFMYSTKENPLPSRKELEKKITTKVLYGLSPPYGVNFLYVEKSLHSVFSMFSVSQYIPMQSVKLVVFDQSIDEVFFSLLYMQNTVTKFIIDDQIRDEFQDLYIKTGYLDRDHEVLKIEIDDLGLYRQRKIGDEQFINYLPKHLENLISYSNEVQRMSDLYHSRLKSLYSSGW